MANEKTKTPAKPVKLPVIAGKLFGLTKDSVRKFNYECYFLVTATVDDNGEIVAVTKSDQSWPIWEALHKMERATELSLIDIMKTPEVSK